MRIQEDQLAIGYNGQKTSNLPMPSITVEKRSYRDRIVNPFSAPYSPLLRRYDQY